MHDEADQAVTTFKDKFAAAYGGGVQGMSAIPFDVILAALMSLLEGCLPQQVKAQSKRPIVQARMRLRLLAQGVRVRDLSRTVAAVTAAVDASTDEEVVGYCAAAQGD